MDKRIIEAINRLRQIRFTVITSLDGKQDAAVCAVDGTFEPYLNPHFPEQRGWIDASEISEAHGMAILADIALVCDELESGG